MTWEALRQIRPRPYKCGYCGNQVANDRGYHDSAAGCLIYICPSCNNPTYFSDQQKQYPGATPGNEVNSLPEDLKNLYKEARDCCSVSAYTSCVLTCRKALMNIAVQQKAKEGLKFIEYIGYLADNGFIPPNGKGWVDHIRKKGNEATHEILLMKKEDAEELIAFTEMLLKFIYEFPNRVPKT